MKNKSVTLRQELTTDKFYIVSQLVNCIEPKVGSSLTPAEVSQLIARRDIKVTIKEAKS